MPKAKHKTVPRELKQNISWLEEQGFKIVLGISEVARHKYAPGHIKISRETPAGFKAIGYSGNGIINFFIVTDSEAERKVIAEKYNFKAEEKFDMAELKSLIDHTNLGINSTKDEVRELCREVKQYDFHSACFRSKFITDFGQNYTCSITLSFPEQELWINNQDDIEKAKKIIGRGDFTSPELYAAESERRHETMHALTNGASELDPVINPQQIEDDLDLYFDCLEKYIEKNEPERTIWVKPIFSCEILDEAEIKHSVAIFAYKALEFLRANPEMSVKFAYKNSTGFIKQSETFTEHMNFTSVDLVSLIAKELDRNDPESRLFIKAAGGIRSAEQARAIIDAAGGRLSHIGSSRGLKLIKN